jgi:hypothetical protein
MIPHYAKAVPTVPLKEAVNVVPAFSAVEPMKY